MNVRLPDPLWDAIEAVLPYADQTWYEDRRVIEAVVLILRLDAHWRTLNPELGLPGHATVLRRIRFWHKARVWPTVEALLRTHLADGHHLAWDRLGTFVGYAPVGRVRSPRHLPPPGVADDVRRGR